MSKLTAVSLFSVLAFAAPVDAQDPAAMVIRVQGDVTVTHGGAEAAPASVGEQMFAGDGVLPASGARAILMTRTGAMQIVTEATTISEPEGGGSSDMFVRAMNTLALAAATDATTSNRQGMIRPIPGATSLLAPRNGLLVATQRPTFHWTPTPDQSYDIMLRRIDGGTPQIFEVGADTVWTPPEDVELEAGATYAWTVFVGGRRGGRPLAQQEFRVMSPLESVDLADYLDEIAVFGLDPMTDGLFLTVIAYRDLGLFYDALDALESVERQASLSAELYLLKGEILTELGHEEAARAAFDKADELMR